MSDETTVTIAVDLPEAEYWYLSDLIYDTDITINQWILDGVLSQLQYVRQKRSSLDMGRGCSVLSKNMSLKVTPDLWDAIQALGGDRASKVREILSRELKVKDAGYLVKQHRKNYHGKKTQKHRKTDRAVVKPVRQKRVV